jgi:hypothetical protein
VTVPEGRCEPRYPMYWLPQVEERPVDLIIPSLRDGAPFGTVPGNKLPGYHHSVPSGQQPPLPVHIFESKSLRSPGFDDEDENEVSPYQSTSGLRSRESRRFTASVGGNFSWRIEYTA